MKENLQNIKIYACFFVVHCGLWWWKFDFKLLRNFCQFLSCPTKLLAFLLMAFLFTELKEIYFPLKGNRLTKTNLHRLWSVFLDKFLLLWRRIRFMLFLPGTGLRKLALMKVRTVKCLHKIKDRSSNLKFQQDFQSQNFQDNRTISLPLCFRFTWYLCIFTFHNNCIEQKRRAINI